MNVTVFGGSGFLGSHVCDKLSDAGHEVTIFDISPSPWRRPDQRFILGNVLDEDAVAAAVKGADAVYNFAGIADIGEAESRPLDTAKFNILGNAVILEATRKAGAKRFVFASSLYVYSRDGGFYRCSKQACEPFIEHYYEAYGLEFTILRYGSLYGPRADRRNAIYRFVREALETGRIEYFGHPTALREYIHAEDAAQCSVEILEPQYANCAIVLTGSQPMRVGDLLKMISEMLGGGIEFSFLGEGQTGHYEITPYSFSPRVGKKMSPRLSTDLGQGILHIMEELHNELHPEDRQGGKQGETL
jgi:UDP-glucose 4-epimerase